MKLLGSAEVAAPAPRLCRRSFKPLPPPPPLPPEERPPIVFLRGEGAELLRLGPRGSPGRLTVRAQLSWRSWGKFCDLRRGRGWGARAPPPAAGPPGGGRSGGPELRGLGGGARAGMNGRRGSAPRLCGPRFLPRPPSRIVCPGAAARLAAPAAQLRGRLHSRSGGHGRPARPRCPLRCLDPRPCPVGSCGSGSRGSPPGAAAAPRVPPVRESANKCCGRQGAALGGRRER